jgi:iron(III) transport system substrate-binding protein
MKMLKTTFHLGVAAAALLAANTALADVTVYSAGPGKLIENLAAGFTAEPASRSIIFKPRPARSWPGLRPKLPTRSLMC